MILKKKYEIQINVWKEECVKYLHTKIAMEFTVKTAKNKAATYLKKYKVM